ncbi:MAG: histidine phosphatase family protein, partial [Actinophytocola sp.]|nr:histidine phosphatase family protein [Actinophytocola sp.]
TDRGRAQAWLLGQWAARAGLDGVYSSDLARARETAQPAADAAGLPLRTDARLRELDFGSGEGLTTAEMQHSFPEALAAFRVDPASHPLPGGEKPATAVSRGGAGLRDICGELPHGRALVVAHSTLIRLLLCDLLGLPLGGYRRVFPFIRNCGLTELLVQDGRAALLQYNTPTDGEAR